jgi:hypothetical protein
MLTKIVDDFDAKNGDVAYIDLRAVTLLETQMSEDLHSEFRYGLRVKMNGLQSHVFAFSSEENRLKAINMILETTNDNGEKWLRDSFGLELLTEEAEPKPSIDIKA